MLLEKEAVLQTITNALNFKCIEDETTLDYAEFLIKAIEEANPIEPQVIPKIADVLKTIDNFITEEQSSYKYTYGRNSFDITKNNISLIRKLKRRIKKQFST